MRTFRFVSALILIFMFLSQISFADQKYRGSDPPSIQTLQTIVSTRISKDAQILGLHKERDGAYLIITNVDPKQFGGPYSLLRLESNEWVIRNPALGLGGIYELVSQ